MLSAQVRHGQRPANGHAEFRKPSLLLPAPPASGSASGGRRPAIVEHPLADRPWLTPAMAASRDVRLRPWLTEAFFNLDCDPDGSTRTTPASGVSSEAEERITAAAARITADDVGVRRVWSLRPSLAVPRLSPRRSSAGLRSDSATGPAATRRSRDPLLVVFEQFPKNGSLLEQRFRRRHRLCRPSPSSRLPFLRRLRPK